VVMRSEVRRVIGRHKNALSKHKQWVSKWLATATPLPPSAPKKEKCVWRNPKNVSAATPASVVKPAKTSNETTAIYSSVTPLIMSAPITPAAKKPPPIMESPANPFYPSLEDMHDHLSQMYFNQFSRDANSFFQSENNVRCILHNAWSHFNIDTLALEDPSGRSYSGTIVFLRECCNLSSMQCHLAAIWQRLRDEWHECCEPCLRGS
jgi:hypothetical protein